MPRIKTAPPRQHWRRIVPAVALLAGLGAFLLLVIEIGKFTRAQISDQDRFVLDFAAVQCPPPPIQQRAEFLAEVQKLGDLPPRLHLLDEALPHQLADAFARHPYVKEVERIAVLSSHEITVQLSYRVPVLEVMLADSNQVGNSGTSRNKNRKDVMDDPSWFVDGEGIVLPRARLSDPLPLLLVPAAPIGKPGQSWGAADVKAAAATAALFDAHQHQVNLRIFEVKDGELRLSTSAGTRVLWGHAPGDEPAGEAKASVKLDRLLDYCKKHGGLEQLHEPLEHDVRPLKEPFHRLLEARRSGF